MKRKCNLTGKRSESKRIMQLTKKRKVWKYQWRKERLDRAAIYIIITLIESLGEIMKFKQKWLFRNTRVCFEKELSDKRNKAKAFDWMTKTYCTRQLRGRRFSKLWSSDLAQDMRNLTNKMFRKLKEEL